MTELYNQLIKERDEVLSNMRLELDKLKLELDEAKRTKRKLEAAIKLWEHTRSEIARGNFTTLEAERHSYVLDVDVDIYEIQQLIGKVKGKYNDRGRYVISSIVD